MEEAEVTRFGKQKVNVEIFEECASPEIEEFDIYEDRKITNPTTNCQTLTHLLKSTLGSGILNMPHAFRNAGIVGGILGGLFVAAVCTHTSYILVDCAHVLCKRTTKKKMDYPDVVEAAFSTGPEKIKKFSKAARYTVQTGIFMTYFTACSADNIIIAMNYGQVINYYMNSPTNSNTSAIQLLIEPVDVSMLRIIMSCVLLPLILLVWVPDLKYLAPISTIANLFMATILGITLYYVVQNPLPISELSLTRPIKEFPQFFVITLFAMQNIGVIMPLENNMKSPQNFLGPCGVLSRGMLTITFIYLLLGVFGYMKYGKNVNMIITTSLPVKDVLAQVVKVLIASTVLLAFSLQFYVCRDMAWKRIKMYFTKHLLLAEYCLRAIMVILCVSIAIAIPNLTPLVLLVGALGFSFLGILGPVIIEIVTYWEIGYGRFNWKIYKNVFLIAVGILAMVFGGYEAVLEIVN